MSDAHFDVIDDDTEVIGWRAIRSGDDEIVQFAVLEYHVAFDRIRDYSRSLPRRPKSYSVWLCGRQAWNNAFRRTASAVISGLALFLLSELALGVQFLRGADARIGFPRGQKVADLLFVQGIALGLIERSF